jgi:GNAT superfamily N-acetyltransferase
MKMREVKIATTNYDIASCYGAMSLLRPALQAESFVSQIKTMQSEGYVLLYISEGHKVVAAAGYRIFTMLYAGKLLYIDDLVTLESHRGKGYASALLHYIYDIALQQNCYSVQLDSGPTRTDAHKLYFKENFLINAFHFSRRL